MKIRKDSLKPPSLGFKLNDLWKRNPTSWSGDRNPDLPSGSGTEWYRFCTDSGEWRSAYVHPQGVVDGCWTPRISSMKRLSIDMHTRAVVVSSCFFDNCTGSEEQLSLC